MTGFAFVPLSRTLPYWPTELFGEPGGLLDEIGVTDFDVISDDTQLKFKGTVAWLEEIELKLSTLDAVSIALLSTDEFTQVPFELQVDPQFELRLKQLHASIRLRSAFLKAVKQDKGKWVALLDPQGNPAPAEITLGEVDAVGDADGDITLVGLPSLSLTPVDIGGTGIVLEMSKIALYLSGKDPPPYDEKPGFKGIAISHAELHLSGGIKAAGTPDVTFDRLLISSSGFSGTIGAKWTSTAGKGELFGMPFTLEQLSLTFKQNVPTGSSLKAEIQLPFFNRPVKVEIGFAADGHLTVGLASDTGLATLEIPDVLLLDLDSLKFDIDDGVLTATMSGKLTPTVPGLRWPAIELKDLKIDSKGNVTLPGGWLDLPRQCGFDFNGFKIDITKFGMGRNEDGAKWFGFSGGVKLIDGLPAGASVEGLRITANDEDWSDTSISFEGVGVELRSRACSISRAMLPTAKPPMRRARRFTASTATSRSSCTRSSWRSTERWWSVRSRKHRPPRPIISSRSTSTSSCPPAFRWQRPGSVFTDSPACSLSTWSQTSTPTNRGTGLAQAKAGTSAARSASPT
jgi:hypothetical protein